MIGDPNDGKRRPDGKFAKGCKPGPGNPEARKTAAYRRAIFEAVSIKDVQDVMRAMLENAKGGDVQAAKVVFERIMGAPEALDVAEKLKLLEESVRDFMKADLYPTRYGYALDEDDGEEIKN